MPTSRETLCLPPPDNPKALGPSNYTYEYLTPEDGGLPKYAARVKVYF
jgi:hypothetical protein